MEIPDETVNKLVSKRSLIDAIAEIFEKLLTNHLISRKAVIVGMSLATLGFIAYVLFIPITNDGKLLPEPLTLPEIILVGMLITGVVAIGVTGTIVQGQIDKQNGNGKPPNNSE